MIVMGVDNEQESELIGQWQVEIPDTAVASWTKWDVLAYTLTIKELCECGDVVEFREFNRWKTLSRGDFVSSNRRRVAEALSHLVALAKVE